MPALLLYTDAGLFKFFDFLLLSLFHASTFAAFDLQNERLEIFPCDRLQVSQNLICTRHNHSSTKEACRNIEFRWNRTSIYISYLDLFIPLDLGSPAQTVNVIESSLQGEVVLATCSKTSITDSKLTAYVWQKLYSTVRYRNELFCLCPASQPSSSIKHYPCKMLSRSSRHKELLGLKEQL